MIGQVSISEARNPSNSISKRKEARRATTRYENIKKRSANRNLRRSKSPVSQKKRLLLRTFSALFETPRLLQCLFFIHSLWIKLWTIVEIACKALFFSSLL